MAVDQFVNNWLFIKKMFGAWIIKKIKVKILRKRSCFCKCIRNVHVIIYGIFLKTPKVAYVCKIKLYNRKPENLLKLNKIYIMEEIFLKKTIKDYEDNC